MGQLLINVNVTAAWLIKFLPGLFYLLRWLLYCKGSKNIRRLGKFLFAPLVNNITSGILVRLRDQLSLCSYHFLVIFLGPNEFYLGAKKIIRSDYQLKNKRGHLLQCSYFEPAIRPAKDLPCVLYLHGNGGCRLDAFPPVHTLLPMDICVFCFDFSGCGLSEGDYISLGFYEREDVEVVVNFLQQKGKTSTLAIWGKSMGAATTVLFSSGKKFLSGIVADAPFASLRQLAIEISSEKVSFPEFLARGALAIISGQIEDRVKADIFQISPAESAKDITCPALIAVGTSDELTKPHHARKVYDNIKGPKTFYAFQGTHNSQRPPEYYQKILLFLQSVLAKGPLLGTLAKITSALEKPMFDAKVFDLDKIRGLLKEAAPPNPIQEMQPPSHIPPPVVQAPDYLNYQEMPVNPSPMMAFDESGMKANYRPLEQYDGNIPSARNRRNPLNEIDMNHQYHQGRKSFDFEEFEMPKETYDPWKDTDRNQDLDGNKVYEPFLEAKQIAGAKDIKKLAMHGVPKSNQKTNQSRLQPHSELQVTHQYFNSCQQNVDRTDRFVNTREWQANSSTKKEITYESEEIGNSRRGNETSAIRRPNVSTSTKSIKTYKSSNPLHVLSTGQMNGKRGQEPNASKIPKAGQNNQVSRLAMADPKKTKTAFKDPNDRQSGTSFEFDLEDLNEQNSYRAYNRMKDRPQKENKNMRNKQEDRSKSREKLKYNTSDNFYQKPQRSGLLAFFDLF